LRVSIHHHIDCIQQSLQVAILIKGGTEIRHDAIAHEHHLFFWKVDEHSIASLTAMNRDEFELRSADFNVCASIDCHIRFVACDVVDTEFLAKKLLREYPWTVKFSCKIFLIIASPVKPGLRIQSPKVPMTAHMIPVCVSDEDGCKGWQPGRICPHGFVGRLCEIRTRSSID